MENKRLASIVICGLLLTTVGCQDKVQSVPPPPAPAPTTSTIRSVAVQPGLGVYNYAHVGDTLEFTALDPNTSPFWVVFEESRPCAEKSVMVTKDTPGQCKVTAQLNVYYYTLSTTAPPALPIPIPPTPNPTAAPRKCPQCQIMLTPPRTGSPTPPNPGTPPATPTGSSANAVGAAVTGSTALENAQLGPVSCEGGTATVALLEQTQGQNVSWYDKDDGTNDVTVTVPPNVCSDANGSQTIFSQYQPCTFTGPPQTNTSYKVSLKGCANDGTGKLTIDPKSTRTSHHP
jgi:hypothetical protein